MWEEDISVQLCSWILTTALETVVRGHGGGVVAAGYLFECV